MHAPCPPLDVASPVDVARRFLNSWSDGDVTSALKSLHPACRWNFDIDQDGISRFAYARGYREIVRRLKGVWSALHLLALRIVTIGESSGRVRARCELVVQDRSGQEIFFGTMRMDFQVETGLITHVDEYHDDRLVASYLRFVEALQKNRPTAAEIAQGEISARVLGRAIDAWRTGDLDGTLSLFHRDCTFAMHVDPEVYAFGGFARGRAAVAERLRTVRELFEYKSFRVLALAGRGRLARSRCALLIRLRHADVEYSGRVRHVAEIDDDRIVHLDVYHDAALFEAYKIFAETQSGPSPEASIGRDGESR